MKVVEYIQEEKLPDEEIELAELDEEEQKLIEDYIDFTRRLLEIDTLFYRYRTDVALLLSCYELNSNDMLIKNEALNVDESDYIVINTLTINCISAAKTLQEAMEKLLGKHDTDTLDVFRKDVSSKIYDKSFSYRFLIRLRDFSQHGYLPVNVEENNSCSFDLKTILEAPYFTHNAKMRAEMRRIVDEVFEKAGDFVRLSFTRTFAEFNMQVIHLYSGFLNVVDGLLSTYRGNLMDLIQAKPEIVLDTDDLLRGLIVYTQDGEVHAFSPQDNPIRGHEEHKDEVKRIVKEEEKYLDDLKQAMTLIKL